MAKLFLLVSMAFAALACLVQAQNNCSATATVADCPEYCVFARATDSGKPYCRAPTKCDIPLNYSLPSPYGCPAGDCEVKSLPLDGADGGTEYCGPRTFESTFDMLYWGKNGSYPFGYLFWNILVALCVVLYLQFSPRFVALILTRVINGLVLEPSREMFHLQGLTVMIIGGRAVLTGVEFLTPNVHIKCVDISLSLKWWRGSSDIRQSPSTIGSSATLSSRSLKLPFRLTVYFTGLEISIFNNSGKYNAVEEFVVRAIYRDVFKTEPPIVSSAGSTPVKPTTPLSRFARFIPKVIRQWADRAKESKTDSSRLDGRGVGSEPETRNGDEPESTRLPVDQLDPLPRAYFLFPITRVQCRNVVVYVGAPTLPSTLVVHIRTVLFLHYTEPIGETSPNRDLDSYRFVNKADVRGVVISMVSNGGYVASEEMDLMRRRMEKKVVDAREVFSEILRNVKTSLHDVKVGMKDVRTDLGQTLGIQTLGGDGAREIGQGLHGADWDNGSVVGVEDTVNQDSAFIKSMKSFASRPNRWMEANEDEYSKEQMDSNLSATEDDPQDFSKTSFHHDSGEYPEQAAAQEPATWSSSFFRRIKSFRARRRAQDEPTLLRNQTQRTRTNTTYKTVRGFVSRLRKKNTGPVAEPDILRTGKIEIIFNFDSPGRVSQKQVENPGAYPPPTQSLILNVGGGEDSDETQIVVSPWLDRQRTLFQEHFFPYIHEDQRVYQAQHGLYREALGIDIKIVFVRQAEVRVAYREQDIGLLVTGRRTGASGAGDNGTNDDSSFWFELKEQLQTVLDEQKRLDKLESVRAESVRLSDQRNKEHNEAVIRRRREAESPHVRALRDMARDSWLLVPDFSMDEFLRRCNVDVDDTRSLQNLVDAFNSISEYQTTLISAVPEIHPSLLPLTEFVPWSNHDRARWLWGQYAGREDELFRDQKLASSTSNIDCAERGSSQIEKLRRLVSSLPLPPQFRTLRDVAMDNSMNLIELCKFEPNPENRRVLETKASDPRCRLAEWFSQEHDDDELANDTYVKFNADESQASHGAPTAAQTNHVVTTGQQAAHGLTGQSIPDANGERGPISYAAASKTTCGWLDIYCQAGSTITINYPLSPVSTEGIVVTLSIDLRKPRMVISATRSCIGEANGAHFVTKIHYPLSWNAEQEWHVSANFQSPKFRILRTDVQALIDLGKDFASNGYNAPSVALFVPASYEVSITASNAEILLNVNEGNVVDLPEETVEHNTYISLIIPNVSIHTKTDAREYQPRKAKVDVSVLWTGNHLFQLPVRASLILPASHPKRSVPLSVGGQLGQGQGGAATSPDPVFMEMQRFKLDIAYTYHYHIHDGTVDLFESDVRFDNSRWTASADAILACKRFQENYLGRNMCHMSQDAFRACNGENLKTLLAYRFWYEEADGGIQRLRANDLELVTRISFSNLVVFVPTILYPRLTTDGLLANSDDEAITVFTREVIADIRFKGDHFADYSCEITPVRVQIPGVHGKSRSDNFLFQDPVLSRLGAQNGVGQPQGQQSSTDSFARLWMKNGGIVRQGPGAEVGQLVLNGIRLELQTLFGRAWRDSLAPLVGYRNYAKVSIGAIWGDLEVPQVSQFRDALVNFDLAIARQNSFDSRNGGYRDPALCLSLPLGTRSEVPIPHGAPTRQSLATSSFAADDTEFQHQKRKSSLSVFGADLEEALNGDGTPNFEGVSGLPDDQSVDDSTPGIREDAASLGENSSTQEGTGDARTVFFRINVFGAQSIPPMKPGYGKEQVTASNLFCQVVYGGQAFRSELVADTSSPDWNIGYSFLAGTAAHNADVQDIRIGVFDGSYGWKRKVGEVVFPAETIRSRLNIEDPERSLTFEGVYLLDSSSSHPSFASRGKPPSASQLQGIPKHFQARGPFNVLSSEPSFEKAARLRLSITFFTLPGTIGELANPVESREQGRRLEHVFESASVSWSREAPRRHSFSTGTLGMGLASKHHQSLHDPLETPQAGQLILDPRVLSSQSHRERFLSNCAHHIIQNLAMEHIVAAYGHNTYVISSGPLNICLWSNNGESLTQWSLSQCKLRSDSLHTTKYTWKLSTDGRDDVSFEIKHLKRSGVMPIPNNGPVPWSLVGQFTCALDARAFTTRSDMPSEIRKQQLFLDTHDFVNRVRRTVEALNGLHGRSSMSLADLNICSGLSSVLDLMPRVVNASPRDPKWRPHPEADSDAEMFASVASEADHELKSLDDGNSYCSVESCNLDDAGEANSVDESSQNDLRFQGNSCYVSGQEAEVFVATRASSLPMDGPVDPYGASTSSLEPFLPTCNVRQYVETNDYWYGSAFGYAMSGSLTSSFGSHQTREMGIAPSSQTVVSCLQPAELNLKYVQAASADASDMRNMHSGLSTPSSRRYFRPVAPLATEASSPSSIFGKDQLDTLSIRVHAARIIKAFITPASIALAEDMMHRWFPAAPTVSQMTDYFEKNYLILAPSPTPRNPLVPPPRELKFLFSCAEGVSLTLMHGSKWTPVNDTEPRTSTSSRVGPEPFRTTEMVYVARMETGPLTLARRVASQKGVGVEDSTTLDASSSSLVLQVASAVDSQTKESHGCFPVLKLGVRQSLLTRKLEEREVDSHQSSSIEVSFKGADLVAGVDSMYVTYSTALTWGELITGYFRESAAIWNRQRRQWALLTGQLLMLSRTIDETVAGIVEKEPRLGLALLTWCRTESPAVARPPRSKACYGSAGLTQQSVPILGTSVGANGMSEATGEFLDGSVEAPLPGWSTLVRLRRIACFLSEHVGIEERMRSVEIDRFSDVHPVVTMETASGIKALNPDIFPKPESRPSGTDSHRHRSQSREPSISKILAFELLMGLANRVVEKRKALGSISVSYNVKLQGFSMRVLDSIHKPMRMLKTKDYGISMISMMPAEVLCMSIQVHPSQFIINRYGKRGSSRAELGDRRASDMQLRRRIVPTSITETIQGISGGFHCATSPELVLASRAGASVLAHYQKLMRLRQQERHVAAEAHKKEILQSRLAANNARGSKQQPNQTGGLKWGEFAQVAPVPPFQTSTVTPQKSEEHLLGARRTILDVASSGLLSMTNATSQRKNFDFNKVDLSERFVDAVGKDAEDKALDVIGLSRTRSFASTPRVDWNTAEFGRSLHDISPSNNDLAERPHVAQSGSFIGEAPDVDHKHGSLTTGRRRVNRSSFAAFNFSRASFLSAETQSPGHLSTIISEGSSPVASGAPDTPIADTVGSLRVTVTPAPGVSVPSSKMSDIQRSISFDTEDRRGAVSSIASSDQPISPSHGLQNQISSATPARRVIERSIVISVELKKAVFTFSATSVASQLPGGSRKIPKSALITCALEGSRLHLNRSHTTAPVVDRSLRDFVLLTLQSFRVTVEGSGHLSRKGAPWVVSGVTEEVVVNGVSGLNAGSTYQDSPQTINILSDGKRSRVHVPLHAIDNQELQEYVDKWVNAFRVASEYAETIRRGTKEHEGTILELPREPAEEAAASLLALGLPTMARQISSVDGTPLGQERLMSKGVGRHGIWPDPFGEVAPNTSEMEPSDPTVPAGYLGGSPSVDSTTSNKKSPATPEKQNSSNPSSAKRVSTASRIAQYQAVIGDRIISSLRMNLAARMHDIEVHISPLDSVEFISEIDHLTLGLDRRSDDSMSSLLYVASSTLRLSKQISQSASHQSRGFLEFSQELPGAWISSILSAKQRPVLRPRTGARVASSQSRVVVSDEPASPGRARSNPSSLGDNGPVEAPEKMTASLLGQKSHRLRVNVVIEAVRHSFTPSVVQQLVALQQGLKAEISVLLESVAKFNAQRKESGVKLSAVAPIESEYSFFLQGLSLRAKASSNATKQSLIWAEVGSGGIELKVTTSPSANPTIGAKITDCTFALLTASSPTGKNVDPTYVFRAMTSIDITNVPRSSDEHADALQAISINISRTAVVIRPRFSDVVFRWQERYQRAIAIYRSSRDGLEEVDKKAKEVYDTFQSDRPVDLVLRVSITESSLVVPFVESGALLSASVTTLQNVEILGRGETAVSTSTSPISTDTSSLSINDAIWVRRWVGRIEASGLKSSFIRNGVAELLSLRWISNVVHKGARCSAELDVTTVSTCAEVVQGVVTAADLENEFKKKLIAARTSRKMAASRSADTSQRDADKVLPTQRENESSSPMVSRTSQPQDTHVSIQISFGTPHVKCDRTVAPALMGWWRTYSDPKREHDILMRCADDVSEWHGHKEQDWIHRPMTRQASSGSIEEYEDDHVHLIHQESTLFFEEHRRMEPIESVESDENLGANMVLRPEFTVDLNVTSNSGKCDFWGEELVKVAGGTTANLGGVGGGGKKHGGVKVQDPREQMMSKQRNGSDVQSDFRAPRPSRLGFVRSRQSNIDASHFNGPHPGVHLTGLRLFVVDLPRFRFGLAGVGTDVSLAEVKSFLHLHMAPVVVSPIVVAYFEECIIDFHDAFTHTDAPASHSQSGSFYQMPGSAERMMPSSSNGTLLGQTAQPKSLVRLAFSVRVSPAELSLKSSQDQPMASLRMRLDQGMNLMFSYGDVAWDSSQRLAVCLATVPSVSLIVHESSAVIQSTVSGLRVGLHRLEGAFPEPLHTVIDEIEVVDCNFNFWRIEAFYTLLNEWSTAWSQLIEEREARRAFAEQQRAARSKRQSGAMQSKSSDGGHLPKKPFETVKDPVFKRNVEVFNNFLQQKEAAALSASNEPAARGFSETESSSSTLGKEAWDPTLFLYVTTRVRSIKFEAKMGVLASNFKCKVANVASRLALPGQLTRSLERESEPDTFYVVLNSLVAEVDGLFEGFLVIQPGCTLFVAREKPARRFPVVDWQPWHKRKTTLNRTFFQCPDLQSSLTRVITGEKAKTPTHLYLLSVTEILLQMRDELDKEGVVLLETTLECTSFSSHLSVDTPPILSEAIEQLAEQMRLARESMETKAAFSDDRNRSWVRSALSRSSVTPERASTAFIVDADPQTLNAFQSIGLMRIRFENFDLNFVHDPSNTAWGVSVQFLGTRLISKKSADMCIRRDLTLQTGGAEIFRYHGHQWTKGHNSVRNKVARVAVGSTSSTRSHAVTSDSPESEEEFQSVSNTAFSTLDGSATSVLESKFVSHDDAATRAAKARRINLAKQGNKTIVALPRSSVVMVTEQPLRVFPIERTTGDSLKAPKATAFSVQPAVVYKFTSTFRDAISVSTDGREYAKLREILSQIRWGAPGGGPNGSTVEREFESLDPRQFQQSDDQQSFVFEPQLNIMGEATTAVLDWFLNENVQLKKNELPKQMHVAITDNLEHAMATLLTITSKIDETFNDVSQRKTSAPPDKGAS